MYGARDTKTVDDTKRFVRSLAGEQKKSREKIDNLLQNVTRHPHGAHNYAYEMATEHQIIRYRNFLFMYLIGSIDKDRLEYELNAALKSAIVEYRKHIKEKEEDKGQLAIIEHRLDFLITATDTFRDQGQYDSLLNLASKYPKLNSIEDAYDIEQPTTFADMNTTDDPVE